MRSIVSAVKMHTLSAVIRIIKLVFNIVLRLGCLCSDGNLRNPKYKVSEGSRKVGNKSLARVLF